jgi:DNA-directed RNA polymerase subunit RPC12/RpoP
MCIEERLPCPRCGHKRVGQHAKNVYVCFQCRNAWSTTFGGSTRPEVRLIDVLTQFQPHERARLIAYRGAVRFGLYTDWPVADMDETQIAGPPQSERKETPGSASSGWRSGRGRVTRELSP